MGRSLRGLSSGIAVSLAVALAGCGGGNSSGGGGTTGPQPSFHAFRIAEQSERRPGRIGDHDHYGRPAEWI